MRNLILAALTGLIIFGLVGCSSGGSATSASDSIQNVDFNGAYRGVEINHESPSMVFRGKIQNHHIQLWIHDGKTGIDLLYWIGTFTPPREGQTIDSQADRKAMNRAPSMLTPAFETLPLTYTDKHQIAFKFAAMGGERVLHIEKVDK